MALNYESIAAINQELPKVDLKGKSYSLVASRIQGFRKLCPEGSITTEIISLDEDRVVMKALVMDETGRILATGTAFESQGSSFVNRTSFIENAETSAVGRALGFLGIGSEATLCSADELVIALKNQNRDSREDGKVMSEIFRIINEYPERELGQKVCERYRVGRVSELTAEDAKRCLRDLMKTVKGTDAA